MLLVAFVLQIFRETLASTLMFDHLMNKEMELEAKSCSRRDQTAFPLTCILCRFAGTLHAYLYLSGPSNFPQ
jgi:hypothetical protein